MAKTIVGTFESEAQADRAVGMLEHGGVDRRRVQVIDAGTARRHQEGWTGEREQGGFWSWLFGDVTEDTTRDFPTEESAYYDRRMNAGDVMVAVTTDDADASQVRTLLERAGAEDVEARPAARQAAQPEDAKTIPVVEEQAKIGKRSVERGHVRVYSHVTERPVEEHLRLREERIRVERRPVDRVVDKVPADAFKDQTIELTERAEEPVIQKQVRVVEEVSVGKDVHERQETVKDRVRRTEVEVDRGGSGFAASEAEFRQHCARTFGQRGMTYEQCSPAYRYGYEAAAEDRYAGDWATIEPEVRRGWEIGHRGTWEQFKDAIRYAWDRARGRQRAA